MALPMQTPTPNPKPRRPNDPNVQGGQDGEIDPMLEALRGSPSVQSTTPPVTPPETLPGAGSLGTGMPASPRRAPTPPAPPSPSPYTPPADPYLGQSPYMDQPRNMSPSLKTPPIPVAAPSLPGAPMMSPDVPPRAAPAPAVLRTSPLSKTATPQQPIPPGMMTHMQNGLGGSDGSDPLSPDSPPIIPNNPRDPINGGVGTQDDTSIDFSQPGAIEEWFAKNYPNNPLKPGSADYWRQKYEEFGRRNPKYFVDFLHRADEIIGLPGSPGNPARQGSAGGTSMGGHGNDWQADPAVHDAILRLLKRGETPVSGDDPAIRAQFNPQSQVLQRGAARSRAGAAERAFAQGQTGEGTMDTSVNAINQDTGLAEAGLMGKLIGDELTARRQDVMAAMSAANDQDRMSLQAYLSRIDAELRKYGIDVNNQQYYDDLGYRIGRDTYTFNQY